MGRRLRGLLALAPLLLAIVVASSGCGDSAEADGEQVGVGQVRVGSVASLVQCRDWVRGTREQRLATIGDIRGQLHPAGNVEPQPDLTDDEAYDLFQRACSQPFASGFRLYKLYARAAAFSSLLRPPGD